MIRLETSNFKGSLTGLLGQEIEKVKNTYLGYRIVNENGKAGRFIWYEEATDTDRRKRIALLYMARFVEGKIWAVGIWAEEYLFGLESGDNGRTWFAAGLRPASAGRNTVNWIVSVDGKPAEKGFAP